MARIYFIPLSKEYVTTFCLNMFLCLCVSASVRSISTVLAFTLTKECMVSPSSLDRLCGLVVRNPGYISRGPGSIPGATGFSEK
jgi:hypothetical protein